MKVLPAGFALPFLLLSACLAGPGHQEGSALSHLDLEDVYDPLGDAPEDASSGSSNYFQARVNDFLDFLSVRLWVGPGLGARVVATRLLQFGLMYRGPSESFGEILHLKTLAAGNCGRNLGVWDLRSAEYGAFWWYEYQEDVFLFHRGSDPWRGGAADRAAAAFEGSVHLALAGATVSFDPGECLDFVAGVFGFGEAGFFD